jgi:hypothetical protein
MDAGRPGEMREMFRVDAREQAQDPEGPAPLMQISSGIRQVPEVLYWIPMHILRCKGPETDSDGLREGGSKERGESVKADLVIYRAVFMGCGGKDPFLPDEPEFERNMALFWWLEHEVMT